MSTEEYRVPEGYYYSKDHTWAQVEADRAKIGITDYAQKTLHEVVFVDISSEGSEAEQQKSIGTVESVKAVSEVLSPLSGKIVEVNPALTDDPAMLNTDPYGDGWIAVIQPAALKDELKILMNAEQYKKHLETVIEK